MRPTEPPAPTIRTGHRHRLTTGHRHRRHRPTTDRRHHLTDPAPDRRGTGPDGVPATAHASARSPDLPTASPHPE
ncbi:hypothetical protein C1N79_24610 [Streptomyces sp. SGAir0924]|nr:hypothetical protein C1N79_24610 [Streptomyces sp. SGAir0924]